MALLILFVDSFTVVQCGIVVTNMKWNAGAATCGVRFIVMATCSSSSASAEGEEPELRAVIASSSCAVQVAIPAFCFTLATTVLPDCTDGFHSCEVIRCSNHKWLLHCSMVIYTVMAR